METHSSTWVGMFDEPNFGEYPVLLTVRDDIRVDYPSLPCGGFLRVEKIEDGIAYLRETISYGRGTCLDGVQVQLSKEDTYLLFAVVLPDGSRGGEGRLVPVPAPGRSEPS